METITNIELNDNGEPILNGFDMLASKYMFYALEMFFYFIPLSLGLQMYEIFINSPLIRVSAHIFGFIASVIAYLFALASVEFIFGQSGFAKEVYNLCSLDDFRIAITLVFLIFLFARFLSRTLNRTVISYLWRKIIFIVAVISIFASLTSGLEYISNTNNQYAYYFNCSVFGIIYYVLFGQNRGTIKLSNKPRINYNSVNR